MKPPVTIEDLPDLIIEYILSYLSPYRDLRRCMQVNKSWYRFVQDVIRKMQRDFYNAVCHMSVQWCHLEAEPGPTITKRYSHSACVSENSMYVFGGCTTANTTFNDLWRLDLGNRCWVRPLATGTYPPPKACATLVSHLDNLILFGGWTHTSPYPVQQFWRVFNQIHVYNINLNRWAHVNPATTCPPVAGHSATVHGDLMVVFGGVQKQVIEGPYQSCNDLWTLDLITYKWQKQNISESSESPPPRYGHSQIYLDKDHLLIMGGCGGPNTLFTDIWLLKMKDGPEWEWEKIKVCSKENGPPHLAFHPACKVGSQVVVMSRTQKLRPSQSCLPSLLRAPSRIWVPPRAHPAEEFNSNNTKGPPSGLDTCVNGKRGVLKRPADRQKPSRQLSSSDEDDHPKRSVQNSFPISQDDNVPSTSAGRHCPRRNRQRQLEGLERMEQRLKELRAGSSSNQSSSSKQSRKSSTAATKRSMCLYVLDISTVMEGFVTWRTLKNRSNWAPEEIILYSLLLGKGELIMFGGIQKDLNSRQQEGETIPEIVSNSLHFMTAEKFII